MSRGAPRRQGLCFYYLRLTLVNAATGLRRNQVCWSCPEAPFRFIRNGSPKPRALRRCSVAKRLARVRTCRRPRPCRDTSHRLPERPAQKLSSHQSACRWRLARCPSCKEHTRYFQQASSLDAVPPKTSIGLSLASIVQASSSEIHCHIACFGASFSQARNQFASLCFVAPKTAVDSGSVSRRATCR